MGVHDSQTMGVHDSQSMGVHDSQTMGVHDSQTMGVHVWEVWVSMFGKVKSLDKRLQNETQIS
jgi:hypothetical protein